ncbi:ABC transporter ATP-binding protein [Diaminobutyricimonas sp. LJ205]|uniref:ABC transporter ATP-binding protein n=1 Tax=Diaminobutyricimonas sp. LJ205 TaxID=2683590 RepID=UPI001E5A4EC0|nr:ABC transporter ATP-binding protein [Diaminobutyricimonas sp. LJ205]
MTLTATPRRTASRALTVTLDGVGRVFGSEGGLRPVLRDVSIDIAAGEIVALLGPSGCGKSTLLRQISGLDFPDVGVVSIDGTRVSGIDERSAVAFQEPRLLPWRTIERNIELGLPRGTAKTAGRARVAELLQLVGLDHASKLRPREVSGGMAQRASLARSLARNPGVLVLDEPFGALDALTRLRMQDLLLDLHAAEPATIVLVTHDVDEALYLADRVVLLGSEPGIDGATVQRIVAVPGSRPRDRADSRLAELRVELLDGLGVPSHHAAEYAPARH